MNAADAIGNAGGIVELSLEAIELTEALAGVGGALAPGRYYVLRVADDGCGIDDDTLSRVFEPFFTTKPPGEGTGLGLAMVHTVVQAHAGKLRVTSSLGNGADFEIYFPQDDGQGGRCG
jgi:signal transduction histidine kinase